jgi:Putative MetA-pathway of phenol degradation
MALLALSALMGPTAVLAGRPLDTEDTGTVPAGRAEIEVGLDHARANDDSVSAALAVIAAGLGPAAEVRLESPLVVANIAGRAVSTGAGDTVVGLKYRLRGESEVAPAVLGAVAIRLPTGDAHRGLGLPGADVTMLVVAGKRGGPVTVHGNAGYTIVTDDRHADTWRLAASIEYAIAEPWTVVAEVVSDIGATAAPSTALVRAGARFDASDRITVDGAVGMGLTRSTPDVVATFGLTLKF